MQQMIFGSHVPLEAVRKTLDEIDTPALDIYTATGLTPAWQQAFTSHRAKDPAYTRVVALVEWLACHHKERLVANINATTGATI